MNVDGAITDSSDIQPPADKRSWLGLGVLMLPVLLVTVDNTVLSFALPQISRALQLGASQQLWMIDAYALVLAGLLVSMGSIGDRIGHRKLLLMGSLGFTVVSVLTAFSVTAGHIIGGRAALGFFGAMLMPSTLALIRAMFRDREQRRLAVAVWATTLTVGSALGPLVGGVLLEFFEWNAIFYLAVPILVPLLLCGPILLPESRDPAPGPIDPVSIVQSLVAMTGVVYAIKHMASVGLDWSAAAAIIAGVVVGVLFVRRQLRQATPLLDIRLFRNSMFTGAILMNLLSLAFLIGFVFFATQFLQLVLELSPLRASLALVPGQVLAIGAGMAVVPVARRMPAHALIPLLLAFAGTAFLLTAASAGRQDLLWIIVAFGLLNIGVGAITTVSNDLVLAAAPANKAGAASAISETAYEVGTVLGTTVLGGLVTACYRTSLQLPDFLTRLQTTLAGETLAGAYHVALALPAGQGSELMTSAAQAFQGGMALVSWVTLGLAVMAMLIAWQALKANEGSPEAG